MKVFGNGCLSMRYCLLVLTACLIVGSVLVTDLFAAAPPPPPAAPGVDLRPDIVAKMKEITDAIVGYKREIAVAGDAAKNAKAAQVERVRALEAEVATEKGLKDGLQGEKTAWLLAKTALDDQVQVAAREKVAAGEEHVRAVAGLQQQMREARDTNTRVAAEKEAAHQEALRGKDVVLANREQALNDQRINELAAKEALIQAAGVRLEQANEGHAAALLAKDRLIQAETDKLTQANQTNAAAVARLNEEHATEKKALEDKLLEELGKLGTAIGTLKDASILAIQ